jgi:dephospho-CoA kinase
MAKVLVTGMSGTGKSAALVALGRRGHRVVDTDTDAWSRFETDDEGAPDWVWREDRISELLAGHSAGHLFVAGCRSNQGQFHRLFDSVVLLSAPVELMLERIDARSDNPFGKREPEREKIVADLAAVEPRLRRIATAEIDTASTPLDEVVRRLERIAAAEREPRL